MQNYLNTAKYVNLVIELKLKSQESCFKPEKNIQFYQTLNYDQAAKKCGVQP